MSEGTPEVARLDAIRDFGARWRYEAARPTPSRDGKVSLAVAR